MYRLFLAIVCTLVLVSACAETPPPATSAAPDALDPETNREAFIAAGAEAFTWPDLIEDGTVSINYGGVVVYSDNGSKVFTTRDGRVIERRWERRADGVVCQELVGNGRVICADDPLRSALYRIGDDLREFDRETGAPRFQHVQTGPGEYAAQPL